jgi:tRNA(Ile)-lysidine synthase
MESRRDAVCFFYFWLVRYAHMTSALKNRLIATVERRAMMHAGDRLGVAVSGGADSVALLLLLMELREKLGIVLSVMHFNHRLRGKASNADEKFVAALARKLGLAYYGDSADVAEMAKREKSNLEDAARRARYAFFERLIGEGRVDYVAVAHTADDQAETVLAHILRGTGLAGLGGIHPVARRVIRPLLAARREELRAYLKSRKQTWREDATNLDTTRLRARIRKKLLPLIEKQFQPGVVHHLTTLAELAREDEAFFDAILEERLAELTRKSADGRRIRISDLLDPWKKKEFGAENKEEAGSTENPVKIKPGLALSKRMARRLAGSLKTRAGELGARHVEAVLQLARHGQSGKSMDLPGGVEVRRERDEILFLARGSKNKKSDTAAREFAHDVVLSGSQTSVQIPELGCVLRLTVIDWPPKRGETSKEGAVLDRDRLRFPMVLRNWRPGDRLRPQGHRSAHRLKRLLNEKRVSRWERDGWPVLTSGGVLAWARGFPVAAEFAANERTRAGIVIAEEKT